MDELNSLSNEELKYRLTQFGFPNLPVTSTTRKVLIKKLRNHMENEKSKLKRETSYVTRYSSDEDQSDVDRPASATKKRNASARATLASISQTASRPSKAAAATRSAMPPPTRTESKVRVAILNNWKPAFWLHFNSTVSLASNLHVTYD